MRYLLLFTLILGLAACDTKVKNVDSCGDGFIDPGEQCDGAELGGATCGTLGYYNVTGVLICRSDCTLDVTSCGGRCGDNSVDAADGEQCDGDNLNNATCATLNYTNGGVLACNAQCRFDASACLTTCGNGNLEPGEPCDDGNQNPGDGCAADCTIEPGWTCEGETVSTCDPICGPGLSFCDPECVDLANDPGRCGSCANACDANERCVGSVCRPTGAPWSDAGTFGAFQPNTLATRYAIAACDGGPFLYAVDTAGGGYRYGMFQLGIQGGQWRPFTTLEVELPENIHLDKGLGVACVGQNKYAMYSLMADTEVVVRRFDVQDSSWKALPPPILVSQCGASKFIAPRVDDEENLHVLTLGDMNCGVAVDYGWWNGDYWQEYPSMTGHPRQLTNRAHGNPSIATFGQTLYIGIAESAEQPEWHVQHRVWTWDGSWQQVGPQLDSEHLRNNGSESISLAVGPDGRLCAAYEKNLSADLIPARIIEVKCLDPETDTWIRLGAGEVNVGHNAAAPSLVFLGTRPVLAYQQAVRVDDADVWVIRVVRWDPETESWEELGVVTGLHLDVNSYLPTLVVQEGRLFLAFLHGNNEDYLYSVGLYAKKP